MTEGKHSSQERAVEVIHEFFSSTFGAVLDFAGAYCLDDNLMSDLSEVKTLFLALVQGMILQDRNLCGIIVNIFLATGGNATLHDQELAIWLSQNFAFEPSQVDRARLFLQEIRGSDISYLYKHLALIGDYLIKKDSKEIFDCDASLKSETLTASDEDFLGFEEPYLFHEERILAEHNYISPKAILMRNFEKSSGLTEGTLEARSYEKAEIAGEQTSRQKVHAVKKGPGRRKRKRGRQKGSHLVGKKVIENQDSLWRTRKRRCIKYSCELTSPLTNGTEGNNVHNSFETCEERLKTAGVEKCKEVEGLPQGSPAQVHIQVKRKAGRPPRRELSLPCQYKQRRDLEGINMSFQRTRNQRSIIVRMEEDSTSVSKGEGELPATNSLPVHYTIKRKAGRPKMAPTKSLQVQEKRKAGRPKRNLLVPPEQIQRRGAEEITKSCETSVTGGMEEASRLESKREEVLPEVTSPPGKRRAGRHSRAATKSLEHMEGREVEEINKSCETSVTSGIEEASTLESKREELPPETISLPKKRRRRRRGGRFTRPPTKPLQHTRRQDLADINKSQRVNTNQKSITAGMEDASMAISNSEGELPVTTSLPVNIQEGRPSKETTLSIEHMPNRDMEDMIKSINATNKDISITPMMEEGSTGTCKRDGGLTETKLTPVCDQETQKQGRAIKACTVSLDKMQKNVEDINRSFRITRNRASATAGIEEGSSAVSKGEGVIPEATSSLEKQKQSRPSKTPTESLEYTERGDMEDIIKSIYATNKDISITPVMEEGSTATCKRAEELPPTITPPVCIQDKPEEDRLSKTPTVSLDNTKRRGTEEITKLCETSVTGEIEEASTLESKTEGVLPEITSPPAKRRAGRPSRAATKSLEHTHEVACNKEGEPPEGKRKVGRPRRVTAASPKLSKESTLEQGQHVANTTQSCPPEKRRPGRPRRTPKAPVEHLRGVVGDKDPTYEPPKNKKNYRSELAIALALSLDAQENVSPDTVGPFEQTMENGEKDTYSPLDSSHSLDSKPVTFNIQQQRKPGRRKKVPTDLKNTERVIVKEEVPSSLDTKFQTRSKFEEDIKPSVKPDPDEDENWDDSEESGDSSEEGRYSPVIIEVDEANPAAVFIQEKRKPETRFEEEEDVAQLDRDPLEDIGEDNIENHQPIVEATGERNDIPVNGVHVAKLAAVCGQEQPEELDQLSEETLEDLETRQRGVQDLSVISKKSGWAGKGMHLQEHLRI